MVRVTVWGENVHEGRDESVRAIYPEGMHATIAAGLIDLLGDEVQVRTATLDQPEHGLTEAILAETDVLTWWGHIAHDEVDDEIVDRVHGAVLGGMGLLALHSRALLQDPQAPARHLLQPALAQRGRARAGVDGQPVAPDRPGRLRTRS